jgi:hypothetical protein
MDQLNTTVNTFRADVEHENQVSNKPPQCITELPEANPQEPEMTVEQAKKAMKDMAHHQFLMMEYPRRTKFRVDPTLPGQIYGLISFIPSKQAKPDADGCFGVLKLRGTFPTVNEADRWAENILRNYDSYSDIDYCYVGKDFPLMVDNTAFCSTTREIDIRKKVEETVKEAIKQKKEEEKKEMEEIQERQQRLLNNKDEKVDIEDIEFYTQLRVKKANAQYMMEECRKRISECEDVIKRTDGQIGDLDEKFPDYKNEFMSKYRHALDSIGSDASQNPLIKYMEQDEHESKLPTVVEEEKETA